VAFLSSPPSPLFPLFRFRDLLYLLSLLKEAQFPPFSPPPLEPCPPPPCPLPDPPATLPPASPRATVGKSHPSFFTPPHFPSIKTTKEAFFFFFFPSFDSERKWSAYPLPPFF